MRLYLKFKTGIYFFFYKLKKKQIGNYPFLLVNVGSGVSILKFTDVDKYERVSGTCVGGGF